MLWPGFGKVQPFCSPLMWAGGAHHQLCWATAGLGWLNSAQVSPAAEHRHAQASAEESWQIAV